MTTARAHCPFLAKACIGEKCSMWIIEWQTDQVHGTQHKHEKCGIAYLPIVLTEIMKASRHTEAHSEKLHEASVQGNQIFSQLIGMARQARQQLEQQPT